MDVFNESRISMLLLFLQCFSLFSSGGKLENHFMSDHLLQKMQDIMLEQNKFLTNLNIYCYSVNSRGYSVF